MMAFEATIQYQAATCGPICSFQVRIPVSILHVVILPCILVEKKPNIIQKSLDITTN